MIPAYLSQLVTDAPAVSTDLGPGRIECRMIGHLVLPSGRIVACDPAVEPDLPPFVVAVPPGSWPVGVTIAHLPEEDQRIAAAWIRLSHAEPVRWAYAQLAGRPERELPAYGVDSATGAFLSAEGAVALAAQLSDDFIEELQAAMEAEYVPTREWALVPIPGTQGLNVATFSSGLGDGAYVSYWGFDAAGGIACLVTDFEIVGRPDRGARAPRGRAWWKFW
jgi:hypothetical protein